MPSPGYYRGNVYYIGKGCKQDNINSTTNHYVSYKDYIFFSCAFGSFYDAKIYPSNLYIDKTSISCSTALSGYGSFIYYSDFRPSFII